MSENVCCLCPGQHLGWVRSSWSLSLWTVPLLHCEPGCCLGTGLRAAWPSPSLMVIGLWCLDSCRPVTSLLKLNYLIRTYHGIEYSEWNNFFFLDSVLPAFQTVVYRLYCPILFHSILFPLWFLYIRDTNLPLCWILFTLSSLSFPSMLCNYPGFFSLPIVWFSYLCCSCWF